MEKTPNYKLSQWEKTDRILMEDFNSDNANVEQALSALAAETSRLETVKATIEALNSTRSALQTEDRRLDSVKLQLVDLGEYTLTGTQSDSSISRTISGSTLSQYAFLIIDAINESPYSDCYFTINDQNSKGVAGTYTTGLARVTRSHPVRMVFFPMKDPDARVICLCLGEYPGVNFTPLLYRNITKMGFMKDSNTYLNGTYHFKIRGIR